MTATLTPRVVVVTRATEQELLLGRHGTHAQARFFLQTRGRSYDEVEERNRTLDSAITAVSRAIPADWRRSAVRREDLDRFLFEPEDLVVVVGQDGLAANVAKYLRGQVVLGLDPEPERNAGVLVRHPPEAAGDLLADLAAGRSPVEERTMVEAVLAEGQRLVALNEVFVGHRSHQSARYRLRAGERAERQSSSGLIVATGTGSTGWAASIRRERADATELPRPEEARLAWFVREAWPSPATGTSLTAGTIALDGALVVESEMEDGVVFGDGMEGDHLRLPWGQPVTVRRASEVLRLA